MLFNVDALNTSPLNILADDKETGSVEARLSFRVIQPPPEYLAIHHRSRDLFPTDIGASDKFGSAIALDQLGTKMIVGAWSWEGSTTNMGGVYTFSFDEDTRKWSQVGSVLQASDFAGNDNFGFSVAISGDGLVLAVGATQWEGAVTNMGAVYIYDWNAGSSTWVIRGSPFSGADTVASDFFGYAVSLNQDGSVLVVAAQGWEGSITNQSGVYTFDWSGGVWVQRGSVLTASDAATDDHYGNGVAISGDGNVLFVGAPDWEGGQSNQGAVYIYDLSGGVWVQRGSVLNNADALTFDNFGNAVATNYDGTTLVVGARFWEGEFDGQGGVYLYDWISSAWTNRSYSPISRKGNQATAGRFGEAVALNRYGTVMAVGMESWSFGATATFAGTVLTYDIFSKRITGTVADVGSPVAREVRAYDRATGYFMGGVVSEPDGTFTMAVKTHKECFVIASDDHTPGSEKNALIADRITPY